MPESFTPFFKTKRDKFALIVRFLGELGQMLLISMGLWSV